MSSNPLGFLEQPEVAPDPTADGPAVATAGGPVTATPRTAPAELKFKYGSKEHEKLLSYVIKLRDRATKNISDRKEDWDDVDRFLKCRVDLSAGVRLGDGTRDYGQKENPYSRMLVLPVTFAMLYVRHTQKLGVLLSRDPQVEGVQPDDVQNAKLVEAMLQNDLRKMNWPMVANQMSWDDERYGLSIIYDTYEKDNGWLLKRPTLEDGQLPGMIQALAKSVFPGLYEPELTWGLKAKYNSWVPVDPRRFYWDPSVPLQQLQRGRFAGHGCLRNYEYLVERSLKNGGVYFNMDAVKENCSGKFASWSKRWFQDTRSPSDYEDTLCVDHLQIKVIPNDPDVELGSEEKPQIWWVTWVNDSVITRAHPCPYAHGKYTYAVGEGIPDEHNVDNPGWGEQLLGIQTTINYLISSHLANVRKTLNNSCIYPPGLIYEEDLLNPTAGGHVRLTPEGERLVRGGANAASFVQQLGIRDLTASHINDINVLTEWAQREVGANDPMQGMQTKDQRTLGEIQTIMASASQRVSLSARMLDYQLIRPLVERAIMNLQQLTDDEQWMRVGGDLARDLSARAADGGRIQKIMGGGLRALIGPQDLYGSFDYIPLTINTGIDPSKQPETWQRVLELFSTVPALQQPTEDNRQPDVHRVFEELIRTVGVKNIDDFYKPVPPAAPPGMPPGMPPGAPPQVQVVPDEQYAQGVQAGNYV
jgi:hypothetical protein